MAGPPEDYLCRRGLSAVGIRSNPVNSGDNTIRQMMGRSLPILLADIYRTSACAVAFPLPSLSATSTKSRVPDDRQYRHRRPQRCPTHLL